VSGTEGYGEQADSLVAQYEGVSFADVHRDVLHLIPAIPGRVLDIGAGTGRDAAALAAVGHSVLAVEPTAAMRAHGAALHPSPRITWLDDSLPDLARLGPDMAASFDLVMLTAVWMHLDAAQRRRAMPRVAGLPRAGGTMILSLRHGPVPAGRRMFDVTVEETAALAAAEGLREVLRAERQPGAHVRPDVLWTRLAFARAPGAL
jgi:SAM-dependent methyltransferase